MEQRSRPDTGAIVFGLILLAVGVYYLLERTFGLALPELDWDKLWPLILVLIGAAIVFNSWRRQPR
jgi:hypothetical protein